LDARRAIIDEGKGRQGGGGVAIIHFPVPIVFKQQIKIQNQNGMIHSLLINYALYGLYIPFNSLYM